MDYIDVGTPTEPSAPSGVPLSDSDIPSYLVAADTHNIANGNSESWGDIITLGTGAVIGSAATQLYNILPTIGNWFGGEFEQAKTKEVLQSFDSDLGKYYERHSEGVDALGFALSSIVPGMVGTKVLRAGQVMLRGAAESGTLGTNLSAATGILAPSQPALLSEAIKTALLPNAGFPVWNSQTIKAVAAGFGQAALEGAAWETAVAATMYNSPVLEKQHFGDIVSNILWGAGAFGILGGTINTASTYFKIKNAGKALDAEAMPWNLVKVPAKSDSPTDKILSYLDQYHATPVVDATKYTGEDAWKLAKFESMRTEKLRHLDLQVRTNLGELTHGDETLAEHLYTSIKSMPLDQIESKLYGSVESARLGSQLKTEKELARIGKEMGTKTFGALSPADQAKYLNSEVVYMKLLGEDAGTVTSDIPVVWNLGDTLKDGQKILVSQKGVQAGSRGYKFNTNIDTPWNIFAADHLTVEARQIWAEKLAKFGPDTKIFENDIPLLDKAFKDGILPKIKVEGSPDLLSFATKDEYLNWLASKKLTLARRLETATANQAISSDPVTAANKLKQWLGIHFNVVDDPTVHGFMRREVGTDGALKSIALGKQSLINTPLWRIAQAAKHEEGHVTFDVMLDAGLIPTEKLNSLKSELIRVSKLARPEHWKNPAQQGYVNDLHELMADTFSYLSFRAGEAERLAPTFMEIYGHALKPIPQELADLMIQKARKLTSTEIAKMVNTSEDFVTLTGYKGTVEQNILARETAKSLYEKKFADAGRQAPGNFETQPTWVKTVKDTTGVKDVNGNTLTGMAAIKQQQVMYENAADAAVAPILGEYNERIFRLSDTLVTKATRGGPGGGMLSAQNENPGTLGSMVQYLGNQTLRKINDLQGVTRDSFNPVLHKLGNNEAAAIEWSVVNAKARQYAIPWAVNDAGTALEPVATIKYQRTITAGGKAKPPELPAGVPASIPFNHPETAELARLHVSSNGDRVTKLGAIRSNQGVKWNRDPERFYPIPPNTKDYPYIASVVDDSISGYGHSKMLYAATAEDLEKQITAVRSADPTLKILTKSDAENWYKSVGQYEFERSLTDLGFDSALQMKGVSSNYLVATNPEKIIADTLNWHLSRDTAMVREAVAHKNESQIATLRQLGEAYANVKDSHFTKLDPISYLEMQGKNPYADYVRSMLGLSTSKEFPFWTPMNDLLERKVSGLFRQVYEMFDNAVSSNDLIRINKHLADAGYEGAAYTAMQHAYANHTAPVGALSAFIAKANSILSSCMLGLDPINAVNNVVGSTVLRSTELKALIRNISEARPDLVGDLAALSSLKVPGTQSTVFSPAKMIATAMGDFHSDAGTALRAEFKARGIITSRVEQTKWVLDNLSLTGKESAGELDSIVGRVFKATREAAAVGEKLTGNLLAEEFNRFVSGHVVKQITDKAVAAGILGEKEAWAYINTFVNRVEGNYIAAQRPGIFQGPIGQAIGLFQTYQFNLMQQLFRHIGEGTGKDVAMMMGLQSSIYGLKGLPAFDAINTHLVGNASGNTNHRDLYDAAFGVAGKEAGDWLMYGMASNALGLISPDLKMNLYTRGDINPRNVTLLPVNPANVPFVQASTKFFSNLYETAAKIGGGGSVWNSWLQGIEHSGVNRPLAGLAQALEAAGNPQGRSYSTSNAGNIVASNDFLSLANLIRVAGAKPLDEAILIDRAFNVEAYASKNAANIKRLGETIKTTVIANQFPDQDQIDKFSEAYARIGGRQEHFAQFMMQQYKNANTSQANILADKLKSPMSQGMQSVMGGMYARDFRNSP